MIDESKRKQGHAHMGLNLLSEYAFNRLGVHQLYAEIPTSHDPSVRLFEKAGYLTGEIRKNWLRKGSLWLDVNLMQKFSRKLKTIHSKLVKNYGWKFLIIGGIGKLISFTTFVVVLGHWFGGLLPEEDSVATIYIYPESTLEEKVEAVRVGVNEAGGHGDRICRVLWARGWDERLKPGKYTPEGTLSVGEAAEKLCSWK